ncbi:dinuclear metal center protein, YbgI/SA1388 family [Nitrosomonas eutropha]|nr:dinuclear metal center protein, YbgI/SA1388 family [Nitrosomonas eutropha]
MNKKSIMHQNILENYLNDLLDVQQFRDYCPNGLQVEGRASIQTLVSGVTASQVLIQAALDLHADAIIVHHGYFWRGEDTCLRGVKRHRIATLIKHDINLYAYHLPLDAHADLGNNTLLGKKLGIKEEGRFGEQNIAAYGYFQKPASLDELDGLLSSVLGRKPLIIGNPLKSIRRIAWCTGAAQGYFEEAIRLGVDAFITGEISEQNVHTARESGTAFISAGHHATERYGIQALGDHIAQKFSIAHHFIDAENPV